MLRDVSTVDTKTRVLGEEVSLPVCVGATGSHRMAHRDGELATARGSYIDSSGGRPFYVCRVASYTL